MLDQFANADNPRIHYETTGPEIWRDTEGQITHFVSAMGTTGTITGVSRYLKEAEPGGAHGRCAAGRRLAHPRHPQVARGLPAEDLRPDAWIDEVVLVSQADAEDMARRLAREEGLFAGISAAGACVGRAASSPSGWRTRPSCSSSATAATAICPPACFLRELRPISIKFCPQLRDGAATLIEQQKKTAARRHACAVRPATGRTGTTRRRCWPP